MPVEPLKIKFVGSLSGASSDDTFVVSSPADYCRASSMLREDSAAGYQSIWVRERYLFSWLQAQVQYLEIPHLRRVEFAETTPVLLLEERWGIGIPGWLNSELILEAGLLQTDLPPGCSDVATGLLAPVLGMLPKAIKARSAGVVAEKASDPAVEEKLKQPLMQTAWRALLDQWTASGTEPWVESFCHRLASNPQTLWRDMSVWRLLRRYPVAALEHALDPAASIFVRSLPADSVEGMKTSPDGRRVALDQIERIIDPSGTAVVTRAKFVGLLEAASGELLEEFSALESALAKADFDVGMAEISAIKERFKHCEGLSTARLAELSLYVPPAKPHRIEEQNTEAAEWVRWAQEHYFPYRWWQIQRREYDRDVEQSVVAFSDWYCHNYTLVHRDPGLSAVQTMTRWRERILEDQVSLVLLVDNLPWFFWDLFAKAMASAGLHRHESAASFVPLPSHTSMCKPLLVSGQAGASGSDYLRMLKKRSEEEWRGRAVHYTMGVDQLTAMALTPEPSVVLLNYLAGDDALHADAEASGSSRMEQLGLLYGNLAKAVGDFARRAAGSGGGFGLYVLTDHGSTMILPEEKQAADAQLTKKLFPNEKHRSATLSEAEAGQMPDNIWKLGHRLTSSLGEGVHFIPRGHNTVAASGKRLTFSHGGATPEEVIVPSATFRLYAAAWKLPTVRFVDLKLKGREAIFYVKRIASLRWEIQNPNREECLLESVALTPEVAEIRGFTAASIAAKGSAETSLSLYFDGNATSVSILTFSLSFRVGQDRIVQTIDLPVTITSATKSGIDLNDLL